MSPVKNDFRTREDVERFCIRSNSEVMVAYTDFDHIIHAEVVPKLTGFSHGKLYGGNDAAVQRQKAAIQLLRNVAKLRMMERDTPFASQYIFHSPNKFVDINNIVKISEWLP